MSAWLLALTLVALGGREAAGLRQSGLYVDNGMDQTLMHRVVSQREKGEVEQEILSLLGLPERPPRHAGLGGAPQVRRSAPKFLLDIYKGALGEERRPLGLSGQELRAIDQSDAIMTFAAHNGHVPGVRHERGKRLWFNVSEAPANERLLGAELRLYRSPPRHRPALPFTLTAYRVLRLQDGQRELQLVDSANASAGHEGWLALNASAALRHWLAQPAGANRGLYLSVHPADGRPHELRPEDVGLVAFRGPADKQPFLVGFFKSSPSSASSAARHQLQPRAKRELRGSEGSPAKRAQGPGPGKKHKPDVSSLEYRGNPYTEPQLQYNSRTCRIQTLYVSFRDLQWQDWIIAPDGYDAYYCSGECNFPLNAHMNATNHAIVQTLVHLVNPGKVPKPCCAPTKLSPISVLYFLDESNVILKKYKNMVVKSCGCH